MNKIKDETMDKEKIKQEIIELAKQAIGYWDDEEQYICIEAIEELLKKL